MAIGIGTPIYNLANLPGQGKSSGGGGGAPTVDLINNDYSMEFNNADSTYFNTGIYIPSNIDWAFSYWMVTGGGVTSTTPTNSFPFSIGNSASGERLARIYTNWNNQGRAFLMQVNNASGGDWQNYGPLSIPEASTSSWLNDGKWRHFLWSQDTTTGIIVLFINGQPITWERYGGGLQTTGLIPGPPNGRLSYDGDLYLGHVNGYACNMIMDEFAYFERQVTEEEAKLIYDSTNDNPGKTANLDTLSTGAPTAWYRMGD